MLEGKKEAKNATLEKNLFTFYTYILTYMSSSCSKRTCPDLGARITGGVTYFKSGGTSKYACQNICCEKSPILLL